MRGKKDCIVFRQVSLSTVLGAILTLMVITVGQAYGAMRQYRLSLAINPVKLVYGLANLEVEYHLAPRVSMVVWGEYVVSGWLIDRNKPPVAVFRISPLVYTAVGSDGPGEAGMIHGFAGYAWSKVNDRQCRYNLGTEAGYKACLLIFRPRQASESTLRKIG